MPLLQVSWLVDSHRCSFISIITPVLSQEPLKARLTSFFVVDLTAYSTSHDRIPHKSSVDPLDASNILLILRRSDFIQSALRISDNVLSWASQSLQSYKQYRHCDNVRESWTHAHSLRRSIGYQNSAVPRR